VDLQDRVAQLRDVTSKLASEVKQARRAYDRRLFDTESAPLWRALSRSPAGAAEGRRAMAEAREGARLGRGDFGSGEGNAGAQLGFLVAVAAGLWLLRRQLEAVGAPAVGDALSRLLRYPILVASGLALGLTNLFHPLAPSPLIHLAALAAIVPWV